MNIICLIGSLREKSYNRALFNTLKEMTPEGVHIEEAPIANLPLFSEDNEDPLPEPVKVFKERIAAADGVIFITPEYNRSFSGVLKNAIDWGTRPMGDNSWSGKGAATMGATPGALGTAAAQQHLRSVLVYLGMRVMGQPEFYLGHANTLVSEDGTNVIDEKTREHVQKLLVEFQRHNSR